jgi:hypothetical protein
MVRGRSAADTVGVRPSQCAEAITMARGRGSAAASSARRGPTAPGCSAVIGDPWEMYRDGSDVDGMGDSRGGCDAIQVIAVAPGNK